MDKFFATMQPYLTFIKDLFTIASLAVASYVAIRGLQTWQRQLKGTTNYELARRLLSATYRLRDALQSVRSPLMTAGEIAHAVKESQLELKPSDADFHAASTAAVYQQRWKPVFEAYKAMEVEAFEAETLWGPKAKEATLAMRRSINTLSVALDMLVGDMQAQGGKFLDIESRKRYREIVYIMSTSPENDPYVLELTAAVKAVEEIARPYLSR